MDWRFVRRNALRFAPYMLREVAESPAVGCEIGTTKALGENANHKPEIIK